MIRVRIPVTPTRAELFELEVFISYKSCEWRRAQLLCSELKKAGLKVRILQPNQLPSGMSAQQIRAELGRITKQSDGLCVLASPLSVESDWVRFEFKEAAQLLGRVLFVFDGELGIPGAFRLPQTEPTDLAPGLFVKHTTICMKQSQDWVPELTVQLCNDPDEGWFDGSNAGGTFRQRRNLKRESARRKWARLCVLNDHKYRNRMVLDVLPFSWEEVGADTVEDVFSWFIKAQGRLGLREALASGEVNGYYTWFDVPDADFLLPSDAGKLHVLVVVRSVD